MSLMDKIIGWYLINKLKTLIKEGKMNKILDFLKGKKTYIIAAITFILAGLQAVGVAIPEYVYVILAALGVTTLRAGIKSAK